MTGWRLAFFAAALFNFAVGLPMVIAPNLVSGGLGMAAACDIRICSEDARFRMPAARLGLGYNTVSPRRFIQTMA